ncbi:nucleoid-associated protein [Acinetobacter bereziniae]|uniref:nucleoid-associated protein n=1 Tax=Acinetobacter bereziniae TaxID=106648 RepID=UPI0019051024|nr:nucleoid-associated protein [Acinetobacter bereziniae]MDG3556348.1 nucleoid-associated protein [Acinetobacter bereziniae]MDP6000444.1 nucleoid-associated protein [Acinetobacter bereziniae]QQC79828.1 nucleoid-associated protein [Acinetobacter bereziniae]UUN92913.1 nucleoid-associated protein [Acinetobacter bereziniae]WMW73979.1 nucleoid-associated protein [Acinetobacter bereziniae]
MSLTNLTVHRIIIHQIFQKTSDTMTSPEKSTEYTNFDTKAQMDFDSRVIGALGSDSKAVSMQIIDVDSLGLPSIINKAVDDSNDDFINSSYAIAHRLAKAQFEKGRSIGGGIVVVFTGTYGAMNKKIIGVMKADIHSGYEKITTENGQISLKHIEDLLLTPSSKLYKTIGFCEKLDYDKSSDNLNDKWSVLISDNQISQVNGKAAAEYFYSTFAGCGYPETSARTTKFFYDATKDFILNLNEKSSEEKYELSNALTTYLKLGQSSVVNPIEFAENFFEESIIDDYRNHLKDRKIPITSFTKDVEHIKNQLKLHKVTFSNNVKIEADPDTFKSDISIRTIEGEKDENGNIPEWTQIIVKSKLIIKK